MYFVGFQIQSNLYNAFFGTMYFQRFSEKKAAKQMWHGRL